MDIELLPQNTVILAAVLGVLISYIEERIGVFQRLSPRAKQTVNTIVAGIVPLLVSVGVNQTAADQVGWVLLLVAPAVVYLGSQGGHQLDRILQSYGSR